MVCVWFDGSTSSLYISYFFLLLISRELDNSPLSSLLLCPLLTHIITSPLLTIMCCINFQVTHHIGLVSYPIYVLRKIYHKQSFTIFHHDQACPETYISHSMECIEIPSKGSHDEYQAGYCYVLCFFQSLPPYTFLNTHMICKFLLVLPILYIMFCYW